MLPDVAAAERFCAPLIDKLVYQSEQAPTPQGDAPDELGPGQARREGDGELTALGRKRGVSVPKDTRIVFDREVKQRPNILDMPPAERANWVIFNTIARLHKKGIDPTWQERVKKVAKHGPYKDACKLCRTRKPDEPFLKCACEAYAAIRDDFVRYFRDPRTVFDDKIIVGAD